MKIGITGASGYVGSKVWEYIATTDDKLYEFGRTPREDDQNFRYLSLREGVEATDLADLDAIIHLAYDFGPVDWEEIKRVNVDGTIELFDAAEAASTHVVQVSSLSAFEGCKSKYGKAKLLVEKEAFERDFHVIRPGLVFGRELGSILEALDTVAATAPIIPIPTGGPHIHYQCHYADLGELIYECCHGTVEITTDPIVAASEASLAFREILEILAATHGNSPRFVSCPKSLVYYGLRSLENVGLNIGMRSDSVVGLVNSNANPDFRPTRKAGVSFRDFTPITLNEGLEARH